MLSNTMAKIGILGAGFGGLEAATTLVKELRRPHEIYVFEKKKEFFMGLSKLWVVTGERTKKDISHNYEKLKKKGIFFVNEEIVKIDTKNKRVYTPSDEYELDFIIIALGAELAPELIPGFEHIYNLYDLEQDVLLNERIENFQSGKLAIIISRTPFKCPPAPYEAAFMLDDFFRTRVWRQSIKMAVFTPEPRPVPSAGKENGEIVKSMLAEKKIDYFPDYKVKEFKKGKVYFENGQDIDADIIIAVPPHRVPKILIENGFAQEGGWVEVDRETLETKFEGIYAVGDCTIIKLANGMPLPKAGIFAENQAFVAAKNIIAEIKGTDKWFFSGEGACFVETGDGKATKADGKFFETPNPIVTLSAPSEEFREAKVDFEMVLMCSGYWLFAFRAPTANGQQLKANSE